MRLVAGVQCGGSGVHMEYPSSPVMLSCSAANLVYQGSGFEV